jgi:azurin
LAKPGETVTFEFDAPKKGNYEYFCSYPGHSQIMRGYLFVK